MYEDGIQYEFKGKAGDLLLEALYDGEGLTLESFCVGEGLMGGFWLPPMVAELFLRAHASPEAAPGVKGLEDGVTVAAAWTTGLNGWPVTIFVAKVYSPENDKREFRIDIPAPLQEAFGKWLRAMASLPVVP